VYKHLGSSSGVHFSVTLLGPSILLTKLGQGTLQCLINICVIWSAQPDPEFYGTNRINVPGRYREEANRNKLCTKVDHGMDPLLGFHVNIRGYHLLGLKLNVLYPQSIY